MLVVHLNIFRTTLLLTYSPIFKISVFYLFKLAFGIPPFQTFGIPSLFSVPISVSYITLISVHQTSFDFNISHHLDIKYFRLKSSFRFNFFYYFNFGFTNFIISITHGFSPSSSTSLSYSSYLIVLLSQS